MSQRSILPFFLHVASQVRFSFLPPSLLPSNVLIQQVCLPRNHFFGGSLQFCTHCASPRLVALAQVGTRERVGGIRRYLESGWCEDHVGAAFWLLRLSSDCLYHWLGRDHQGQIYSSHFYSQWNEQSMQSKPSFVRFYRDYSIADFSFATFFTAVTTYAAFRTSARTSACDELSRHPQVLRDMLEMGLSLENCERWLERAVLAFVAVMVVVIVIRVRHIIPFFIYCRPSDPPSLHSSISFWQCLTFTLTSLVSNTRTPTREITLIPVIQTSPANEYTSFRPTPNTRATTLNSYIPPSPSAPSRKITELMQQRHGSRATPGQDLRDTQGLCPSR